MDQEEFAKELIIEEVRKAIDIIGLDRLFACAEFIESHEDEVEDLDYFLGLS